MTARNSFVCSDASNPHRTRAKKILEKHPDVRKLIGKNPNTFIVIVGLVVFQIGMASIMAEQSWWIIVGTAYLIGAFVDHALFVMIHECTHRLVFRSVVANRLAGMVANIPQILPSAISFERYHIKHHSGLGVPELDGDLPNKWEAKLINNYSIGKALWLLLYPFFQLARLPRLKEVKTFDAWIAFNWVVQIVFIVIIFSLLGFKAIIFLVLSFFFSIGFHPLGARWIQEHYLTHGEQEQETYSYYGTVNRVAFNIGYHNEHHDFPSIPWNKLPQLKAQAPSFYNALFYHTSLIKLFFRFLFDKEISLYLRIVRRYRGQVKSTDHSKSDIQMSVMHEI